MKRTSIIGSAIRLLRMRLHLKQSEFALLIGVSQTAVVRFEAGQIHPDKTAMHFFAELARGEGFEDLWTFFIVAADANLAGGALEKCLREGKFADLPGEPDGATLISEGLKRQRASGLSRRAVSAAIKSLRQRLGQTVSEFSAWYDISPRTLARWESTSPPRDAAVLRDLEAEASDKNHGDLAAVFKTAADARESKDSVTPLLIAAIQVLQRRKHDVDAGIWTLIVAMVLREAIKPLMESSPEFGIDAYQWRALNRIADEAEQDVTIEICGRGQNIRIPSGS